MGRSRVENGRKSVFEYAEMQQCQLFFLRMDYGTPLSLKLSSTQTQASFACIVVPLYRNSLAA